MGKRKNVQRSWESPSVSITNPGIAELFGALPSAAGPSVNHQTVYALPALLHGIDLIASTIGRIDCPVYREDRDGTKTRDKDHPADYLLMRRPNDHQTAFEFRRELASDAVMGNAYAYVARDDLTAEPTDLVVLDPQKTWPVVVRYPDLGTMKVYYIHEQNGKQITLDASEVVHVKGRVRLDCGLVGRNLLDAARDMLGLNLAILQYGSAYFQNSGLPSMIIEMPNFLKGSEQIEQFRQGIEGTHRGVSNAHKTMILQNGAKATRVQIDNDQAQYMESRQMALTDIALLLGVPGSFLGSKQNTSYGSLSQDALNLLIYTFSQWFANFEQAFDRLLLTENQKRTGNRWVEFNKGQLLEADHQTSVKTWSDIVNNGLALPNVACAALSLPPLDEDYNRLRLPSTVAVQQTDDEIAEDKQDQLDAAKAKPAPVQAEGPAPAQGGGKEAARGQDDSRLASLTTSVLQRFQARLLKASEASTRKDERLDLTAHRDILVEAIAPVAGDRAERMAGDLLDELAVELGAALKDQQSTVVGRIDPTTWTRRILHV